MRRRRRDDTERIAKNKLYFSVLAQIKSIKQQLDTQTFNIFIKGLQDGTIIPQSRHLQNLRILDVYLKGNDSSGNVILVVLHEHGIISSYLVERNYVPLDKKRQEKQKK